ncbi:MAG: choice-of-anchor D domain-containing protein [Bacteroidales bacterium]|nr:choice-of-anchor D domain-containing protein [Bacteroidales bacterium]
MDTNHTIRYIRHLRGIFFLFVFLGFQGYSPAQNYSLLLDGNGDYVNTSFTGSLNTWTLEAWIKDDGTQSDYCSVIQTYTGADHALYIYPNSNGNVLAYWPAGGGSTSILPNQWMHVAATRDANGLIKYYVNGAPAGSSSTAVAAINKIQLGGSGTGDPEAFSGLIDEVRIWDIPRSEEEVATYMNIVLNGNESGLMAYWNFDNQAVYDITGNGNEGTLYGDASLVSSDPPVYQYTPGNDPFEPVPSTGLPYNIVLDEVLINGDNVPLGTQIGVFDEELCVGSAYFDGNPSMNLVAWQADPGQNLAGFTPGNPMTFKYHTVWYSIPKNFDATSNFIQGNGTFGNGTFSVVELSTTTDLMPDAVLSGNLINFNTVVVNQSSTFPLVISNDGTAILHIQSFDNEDSHFTLSSASMLIAPGANDTLWIEFIPTAVTAYSDMLTIVCDDPDTPLFEIPLFGTGLPQPTPQISVTPSNLNFGGIPMNTTKNINLNIYNGGNGTLSITGISSSNSAFSIFGATSFTLGQGQNRNVAIIFAPVQSGSFTGNITIQSNFGTTIVPASGIASQGHFSGVNPTGKPYSIIIEDIDIDGFRPKVGDEVAVFDDALCVGVGIASTGGKSLQLDGSGDFVINDNSAAFDVQELTISAWIYASNYNQNGFIFEKGPVNSQYSLFFEGTQINFRTYPAGSSGYDNFYINSASIGFTNSQWHFVTATYDGNFKRIYVDGELKGSQSYNKELRTGQSGQIVGAYGGTGGHSYYFNGNIDEVRVWDYARTQFEITQDMFHVLLGNEPGLVGYWNFDNSNFQNLVPGSTPSYLSGNANTNGTSAPELFSHLIITAWEKDDGLGLPGFTSGNTMSFKVYTEVYDNWLEVETLPAYSVGNGNFGFGQLSVLTLEGTSGLEPDIDVPIESLYVGQVIVGESVVNEIKLYNTGNAPLHFFISDNSAAFSTGITEGTILAADSLVFEVTFAPPVAGGYTAELIIDSNDPDEPRTTLSLEGFALPAGAPDISTSLNNITFGNVEIDTEKTESFFVINSGTSALTVSNIVSGDPAYTITPTSFTLQNTNDLKEVFVTFHPLVKGEISGVLTIASNASAKSVSLVGVGIDNHFNMIEETGIPYYIIVDGTNLDEYIEAGDELGAFDGNLCVGMADVNLSVNSQSASFDGSGDYVQADHSPNLTPTHITVEAWVNTTDGNASRTIVSKTTGCASSGYLLWLNENGVGAGKPGFWVGNGPWLDANIAVNDGQWHHIAGTYDGITAKIFVDGVLYNSRTETENLSSTSPLQIGGSTNCGNYLNGKIDEVRIWNYALSENEVNTSMSQRLDGNETGLEGYWPFDGNFLDKSNNANHTVSYGNTSIVNSTPLLLQNEQLSITAWQQDLANGLPGFTPGNAMTFKLWTELNGIPTQLNATPTFSLGNGTFGFGQFSVVSLEFGLPEIVIDPTEIFVALNEPDSTIKTLNIHNEGTENLYFKSYLDQDPAGESLLLDGSNDYVALGNLSPGSQWTAEAWVNPSSTPSGRRAIFGGHNACSDWGIVMSGGIFGASINPPSECSQTVYNAYSGQAVAGSWTHVAATCDGTTAKLYVNGELIASAPVLANYIGYSSDVRIGGEACCSGNNFPGMIDEVRLWNYARTQSEISATMNKALAGNESGLKGYWNFNDGTATDLTINGYNGNLLNGASINSPGAPGIASWVKVPGGMDTLSPGQAKAIEVKFYSEGLIDGLYQGNLVFANNTINNPGLAVPVTLNVTGNPQIEPSVPVVDFGQVIVNNSLENLMSFQNIGTQNLIVQDIVLQQGVASNFSADLTGLSFPLTVVPGDEFFVQIGFSPLSSGPDADTLIVISNASNAPNLKLPLSGEGITPPDIGVSQAFFSGTFACNDVYIDSVKFFNSGQENLEFSISSNMDWLSGSPSQGLVAGGDSLSLILHISTLDLFAGDFDAILSINSNDPDEPETEIQYSISVTGDPSILANDFLNLGTGNVGDTLISQLLVANSGCDTLEVFSVTIESQQPVFFISNPAFSVPPGDAKPLYIGFTPQTTFQYSGIINITSNDAATPLFPVVISATGVEPPNMAVNPLALSSTLQSGETEVKLFNVQNTGGQTLNFQSTASPINPHMLYLDGNGDYINVVHNNILNPTNGLTIEAWIYLLDNTNEFIAGKENSTEGKYRLWVNENHRFEFKLNNLHSITSASQASSNQWIHVAATFDGETMKIFINGNPDAEQSFSPFSIVANTDNLRIGRSYQYAYFNGKMDEVRIWNIARNQSELQSAMNQPLLGSEPELVLYFPFTNSSGNIVSDASSYANNGILYGNPARQNSTIPFDDYMTLSNNIGTLTANQSKNVNVSLNSTGFMARSYQREITVSGNALENPSDVVNVALTIEGTRILTANPLQLQFEDTFIGLSDTLELAIENSGALAANITNTTFSNPAFYPLSSITRVFPFSQKSMKIVFEPSAIQQYAGSLTLTIENADVAQIIIPLSGLGLTPPVPVLLPNAVNFGEVVINLTGNESMELSNTGSSALEVYGVSFSDDNLFDSDIPLPQTLAFGESVLFDVMFTPANYNVVSGEMLFNTNVGIISLPLSGTGVPPDHDLAVVNVISPLSGCGLSNAETLTVTIRNYGELDQSDFEVGYSLNNGPSVVETLNGILPSGDAVQFTFGQSLNLVSIGTYHLEIFALLQNDENTVNDTLDYTITNSPSVGAFTNLMPADSSFGVLEPVSFSWDAVSNASSYDLYIWRTNQQKPVLPTVAGIAGTNYIYYEYLNKNYLYYWQLTAKNQCSQSESEERVFSFNVFSDLTVAGIIIPDTGYSGETVDMSYTISNIGTGGTGLVPWTDNVYISESPVFNQATATSVATLTNVSALSGGQSYTKNLTFELPDYLGGAHYVFVKTDINNKIQETDENNNLLASADAMEIILPPYPDLAVSGVQSMKGSIVPGETFSVGWIVENIGDAPAIGGWSQRVSIVAGSQRKILGHVQYTDTLEAGGILSQSSGFTVPQYPGMEGQVFIEVLLTPYTGLVETPDGASNNLALSDESFTLEKVLYVSLPQQTINENRATPLVCTVYRSGSQTSGLVVNFAVNEPTRITVPVTVTIPANQSGKTFNLSAIDNALIEGDFDVDILAQATDYDQTTAMITVLDNESPSLFVNLNLAEATEGDQVDVTISRDLITDQALDVNLFAQFANQIDLPASVTIDPNEASVTIAVDVIDDVVPELTNNVVISASRTGYISGSFTLSVLDNDIPQVTLTVNPTSVSEAGGPYAAWGTVSRLEPGSDPVTILLSASPVSQLFFPAQVTIPGGMMEKQFNVGVIDNGILDGDRIVEITGTIYLSSCGCGVPEESGGTASAQISIVDNDGPSLSVASDPIVVPEGMTNAGKLIITRNTLGGPEIQLNLTHNSNDEITLPATAVIPEDEDVVEVPFNTIDDGIEDGDQIVSVTVSAPGYSSGNCWVMVSDRNLPDFVLASMELSQNTMLIDDDVDVNIKIVNNGFAVAPAGAMVKIYKSNNNVLDANDAVLSTMTTPSILAIGDSVDMTKTLTLTGNVGDYYIFATVNKDGVLNELIGINNTSEGKPLMVIPDYNATVSVDGDVFNGTSPVTISGVTEYVNKAPAANKPVDIYIIVQGVRRVYPVTSDANGEFSMDFTPLNGEAGDYSVGACYPNQGINTAQDSFVLLGAKRTSTSFLIWELYLGETQQKFLEIKNLSSLPLNNVDIQVLSAPAGCNVNFLPVANMPGNSFSTISYSVDASVVTSGTLYEEVKLRLTSAEGTKFDFSAWFYCSATKGNLKLNPTVLNRSMVKDMVNYVEFEVTNNGLDETGLITIQLPEVDWMSMASPDTISSLQPGESAIATLRLTPGDDLQLNNPITGSLALSGTNSNSVNLPFSFEPISDETGDLLVDVVDEYTYNTAAGPHVDSATVIIKHPYTGQIIAQGLTDANGHFLAEDIPEGYYTLNVQAPMHGGFQDYIYIEKGVVNNELVFIAFQAITYSWDVVPTVIEDEYEITLVVEFETNVPAPVVLMNMPDTLPHLEQGEYFPFILTLTNVGLITAQDVEVTLPEDDEYMFTANVDQLDILPQQAVQIPVLMERRPPDKSSGTRSLNCSDITITKFKFECGPDDQIRIASAWSIYLGRVCSGGGSPGGGSIPWYWGGGGGGPGGPGGGGGGGGGGGSGPSVGSGTPYQSSNTGCDPCVVEALNCALDCINPIPPVLDCGADVYANGLNWGNGVSCAWGIVDTFTGGSFGCAWCVGTTIGCFINSAISSPGGSGGGRNTTEAEQVFADMQMLDKGFLAIENWSKEQAGNDDLIAKEFFGTFNQAVAGFMDNELPIDPESQDELLTAFVDTDISEIEILNFVSYWNNTVEARNNGVYSPTPEYPNIIDTLLLHHYELVLDTVIQYVHDRGYPSMDSLFNASAALAGSILDDESSSVCATVTVQFSQTLTMTREAFEGTLTIFNGHETDAMQNISLDLEVKDENGVIRNDLFQINTQSLDQITGIDGSGILDALTEGTAVILFIPERGAAPDVPRYYSFGGTLSYLDPFTGEIFEQPLFPVTLQVNPSPNLYLSYFMQRDIFGDDALTEPIEPMIPAELAVMINNQGAGTAMSVNLESAQPEIIENEKGLLIDFEIIGSNLGGQPTQLGIMDVDFGDIPGGEIAVGQWWFTSTLLGHFISYEASVNHLDSYGNPDLSLVSGIEIHELIKSITVYGPLDDSISDFLVNDIPDVEDIPDAIYYSNGAIAQVVEAGEAQTDAPVTLNDTIVDLTVTPSAEGWNYAKIDDPGNGLYRIVSITRDDGQVIPLNNVWLTYSTIPDGGEPIYENKLHFVDTFGDLSSSTYTIVFEPIDQDVPSVVAINGIPEGPTDTPVTDVEVVFSEPIDASSFTYEDMTLKNQGGPNLMDTLVIISAVNDSTYNVDISDKTSPNGYYTLTVQAAGVTDLVGNFGKVGVQVAWLQSIATPAIDYFFGLPEQPGAPIDTLLVLFNMPINTTTFTKDQLILKDGDGVIIPTESLVITSESFNDVLFKISGLEPLTTVDGSYELTFKLTEIQGENGQIGLQNQSVDWVVCQIPFPVAHAGSNTSVCDGESKQLSGSVENASSFLWSTSGDGTFDDAQSLSAVYTPGALDAGNGSVQISLTAQALNDCAGSAVSSITVTILDPPAAYAGADAEICESDSHQLFGTVQNTSGYAWSSAGDGTFSNAQVLTPTYSPGQSDIAAGSVEISLIASPLAPCELAASATMTLNIQNAPDAFAGASVRVCENQPMQLQATVLNFSSLLWISTGDGTFTSRTISDPVYTFGTEDIHRGFANLVLLAQPVNPCFFPDFSTILLYVDNLPHADAGNDATICVNQVFQASGTVENESAFAWSTTGDGTFSDDQVLTPVYNPGSTDLVNGFVQLSLTAQASGECTLADVSTMTLSFQDVPQAFAGDNAEICENQSIQLNGSAQNASSVIWLSFGGGSFDDIHILNPVYTPGQIAINNGTVTLGLIAQPVSPCVGTSISNVVITIQSQPLANAGADAAICENQSYQLSGIVENAAAFEWQTTGDGTFNDVMTLDAVYTPGSSDIQNGAVTLTLVAQPANPCDSQAESTMLLEVNGLAMADAGNDATVCENQDAQLSGTVANQSTFHWETSGDGVFNNFQMIDPAYSPGAGDIANGSVEISLIAEPESPCIFSAQSTIQISIQRLPVVNAGEDFRACHNQSVQLNGSTQYSGELSWSTNGDGTFDDATSTVTIYHPGENDVEEGNVTLTLSAFSTIPCLGQVSDNLILTINHCQDIDIPSGWSGISSYIDPLEAELDSVFNKIMNDLIILQSQTGIYWPGQNVNTIGQWNVPEGYAVKLANDVSLSVVGSRSSVNSLDLSNGWTILPVLSTCDVDVASLFQGSNLVIVKEVAGWRIYWPELNINNLVNLQPGKSYYVLMNSQEGITFPACLPQSLNAPLKSGSVFDEVSHMPWNTFETTVNTHIVGIPESSVSESLLRKGDLIGVFDASGICYGIAVWDESNTNITLVGDDPMTKNKDGFAEGEPLYFRAFVASTSKEYNLEVVYSSEFQSNDGLFETNGLSLIDDLKLNTVGVAELNSFDARIYPNPASDKLFIDFENVQPVNVVLYDVKGQVVLEQNLTELRNQLDISKLRGGVYLIRLEGENIQKTERIIKK